MPQSKKLVPAYRLHKASGQALVTLNGHDHYLGPYGSDASRATYDRLIAEWLNAGRYLGNRPGTNRKPLPKRSPAAGTLPRAGAGPKGRDRKPTPNGSGDLENRSGRNCWNGAANIIGTRTGAGTTPGPACARRSASKPPA